MVLLLWTALPKPLEKTTLAMFPSACLRQDTQIHCGCTQTRIWGLLQGMFAQPSGLLSLFLAQSHPPVIDDLPARWTNNLFTLEVVRCYVLLRVGEKTLGVVPAFMKVTRYCIWTITKSHYVLLRVICCISIGIRATREGSLILFHWPLVDHIHCHWEWADHHVLIQW